jgi:hypothetical protein
VSAIGYIAQANTQMTTGILPRQFTNITDYEYSRALHV